MQRLYKKRHDRIKMDKKGETNPQKLEIFMDLRALTNPKKR
jgi:hypothetical protein